MSISIDDLIKRFFEIESDKLLVNYYYKKILLWPLIRTQILGV